MCASPDGFLSVSLCPAFAFVVLFAGFCLVLISSLASSCQANEDITQIVEILSSGPNKWNWLTGRLVEFTSSGSVLLFVTKKANAEELANNLKQEGHSLGLLHGDMDQSERNKVISDFKKGTFPVLVATDVAGGCATPSYFF